MHVLSLPPAFVLSQDQTLKLRRLDWLLVTHESTRTFTPHRLHDAGNFLSKRDPPKSRSNHASLAGYGFSRTLPPTFLFLQYSIVKEPTPQTRCRGPCCFWLGPGRVSLTRLSWISQGRTSWSPAARRPRCGAYIVGGLFGCQHRSCRFFEIFATAVPPVETARQPAAR